MNPPHLSTPTPQHHLLATSELSENIKGQDEGDLALGVAAKGHPDFERLCRQRHIAAGSDVRLLGQSRPNKDGNV